MDGFVQNLLFAEGDYISIKLKIEKFGKNLEKVVDVSRKYVIILTY